MVRSVEALAQIRLNPTSVEQFLTVACSLADERPDVKDQIYSAAREAQSATLMIDHIRNLFSHQCGVESAEQLAYLTACSTTTATTTNRRFVSDFRQALRPLQGLQQQQQQQPQHQPKSSYGKRFNNENNISNNNNFFGFSNHEEVRCNSESEKDERAQLRFTYTNQQNLVKASKCLASNVAKILYLTDTIDTSNQHEHQPTITRTSCNPNQVSKH